MQARCGKQSAIKQLKDLFLAGESVDPKLLSKDILESWKRSRQNGVDSLMVDLPGTNSNLKSTFDERWLYQRMALNGEEIATLEKDLSENNAALIYTDADLTIINQRGNEKFLDELAAHNFVVGQSLSEKVVGTNAVSVAVHSNSPVIIQGQEHYCAFFDPYTTIATKHVDIINNKCMGYMCIIVPNELYTPFIITTLNLLKSLLHYSESLGFTTTSFSMVESLWTSVQTNYSDKGLLFVSSNRYLLWANQWVLDRFELNGGAIAGVFFEEAFPELQKALSCLTTGKPIDAIEISFARKNLRACLYMSCKPIREQGAINGIVITLQSASSMRKLVNKISNHNAFYSFDNLIGSSDRFTELKNEAIRAANSPSNILITGESGTGKELFAHSIHNESHRKEHPFLALNCAAFPRELINSELFGYTDGAFTGARKTGAPGKFELAHKGTIFLDEIGDMPLDTQATLLRVLEERQVTRLGAQSSTPVDVRIVAATNKNLWDAVVAQEFRMDLYYRLEVIELKMIPLRERKEDIPLLIEEFIKQFNESLDARIEYFTQDAIDLLMAQSWPGNIRELRNIVERVGNLCPSSRITSSDLLKYTSIGKAKDASLSDSSQKHPTHNTLRKDISPARITELMTLFDGNKAKVARELGISRATLYSKLKDIEFANASTKAK